MDRNDLLSTAGETIAYAEDFIETKIELLKLDLAEKGSKTGAMVITGIILAVLGLFALGFLMLALAFWIGSMLDSSALGLLLVGVLLLIIAAVVYFLRDSLLTTPILQSLLQSFFANKEESTSKTTK